MVGGKPPINSPSTSHVLTAHAARGFWFAAPVGALAPRARPESRSVVVGYGVGGVRVVWGGIKEWLVVATDGRPRS